MAYRDGKRLPAKPAEGKIYAALDLGTNNCRLLIASEESGGEATELLYPPPLKVLDSFSRIVRLGEGVSATGSLSDDAMERTLVALRQCQKKIIRYEVTRSRFVATEACRRAKNGEAFLHRVERDTGMSVDIISSEEEARLAFLGCASLLSQNLGRAIVFDIGGGSTELMWVDAEKHAMNGAALGGRGGEITDWLSIGHGVMNLADKFGGHAFAEMYFGEMVDYLVELLRPFDEANQIGEVIGNSTVQLLSTSGTVTTLAAIHLELPRYDRARIDGIRLKVSDLRATTRRLLAMRASERFHHPCIGPDRADYIIAGCAIFEAISTIWPMGEITVADRGVREGIIISLINGHG